MNTKENFKTIAAYGSLRLNEYNYNYLKSIFQDQISYSGCLRTLKGYDLYSLGSYPAVLENDSGDASNLVVDIIKCSNDVYHVIKQMEENAGYVEKTFSDPEYGECIIYVYEDPTISVRNPIIESGDWSLYLREKNERKFINN